MPERLRRSQDKLSALQRPAVVDGLLLGLAVAALAVLGISLRPVGGLAPLWPAAPVFLGLLLRFPGLAHGWSWLGGAAGLVAAEHLLGTALWPALWMALGGLLSTGVAYLTFSRTSPQSRSLRTPAAMLHLLLACLVAAVIDGVWTAQVLPVLIPGMTARTMLHEFAADMVNYVAFLPLVLTLPSTALLPWRWSEVLREQRWDLRQSVPIAALLLSTAVAWAVQSKGAAVFAIPALLWCAISYSLFASAALACVLGMGFFLATTQGWLGAPVPSSLQLGQLLTDQLALAVLMLAPLTVASVNAALHDTAQRLQLMADFDQLTRLPVRSAFLQWGLKLLQHRYMQRLPVSVVILDVDQLQHINNTYGHAAGDKVLSTLARHLQSSLRRRDCLGRLGGEEFGVILCSQTEQDTLQVVERICLRFALLPIVLDHGETVHCTVTAGGVTAQRAPLALAPLLSQAETALRAAKRKGKGQWEVQVFVPPPAAKARPPSSPRAGGSTPGSTSGKAGPAAATPHPRADAADMTV